MNVAAPNLTENYSLEVARLAKRASKGLVRLSTAAKNNWLIRSADEIESSASEILAANAKDLAQADDFGLSSSAKDRLRLDQIRLGNIAAGLRQIAALQDPVGEVIEGYRRPNGLEITKVRVPLGVVFFIYESRPNVTADAAAICIKSGNAVILRGGKEALHSNLALVQCLRRAAEGTGVPAEAIQFIESPKREIVGELLKLNEWIDVTIPRGGESLIRRVTEEATMPVIKHFDGNCHLFVDREFDLEKGIAIIENAKCQRMGVCNALESLLVHQDVAVAFLPELAARLKKHAIEIRGCERTLTILPNCVPATVEDWSKEYLGPTLSIKIVNSIDEAIEHINHYGSHHTDGILTKLIESSEKFLTEVDSAAVMVNASTRFNDGGEFGFGAEIGISTDKFHARGPCGLRELTSYKYRVVGNGQIRV